MHQKLIGLGWTKYHDCQTCPNNPKAYYSHPDHKGYDIMTKLRSKTFTIRNGNTTVGGPYWDYQMEEKIKDFKWV